ncbi:MAG: hypothetical protein KAJ14_11805 [Candidatus Omnitrophica bacterium]|nr:hypothetical protein [Candidatus Omnitrophota bacterium]
MTQYNSSKINHAPTHTTIINWIHKIGLFQLNRKKEVGNDWILILDHSIQIGKEMVFVVFGLREKNMTFDKPLGFQDLEIIRELSREKWTGEDIQEILLEIKKELGNVLYAISDGAGILKKGLRLSKIKHSYDITHKIAIIIKHFYGKDKTFIDFTHQMTMSKKTLSFTDLAFLLPPKLRGKSRFSNIGPITNWGINILNCLDKPPDLLDKKLIPKISEKFGWIKQYRNLILELSRLNKVICSIQKIIKSNGLSKKTKTDCIKVMEDIENFENGIIFKNLLTEYFDQHLKLIKRKSILCCSDIIESAFGKYKNYISHNPLACVTNLILCIAAFTSKFELNEIKQCMEEYTINDVKEWTMKNIKKTMFQKRKECFI